MHKKCFFASTGLHLLLVLILFIGPAFLSSNKKGEERPLIDFIPLKTIDEAFSGGGNPNARPPQPAPHPPALQSQPPPPQLQKPAQQQAETPKPVQPAELSKPVQRDPEAFDIKPAKKLPNVSVKPVTRHKNKSTAKQSPTTNPNSRSAEADEWLQRLANATRAAANNLREGFSSSTSIELQGPGGRGVPYANFLDALKKIYTDAWIVPDGVADNDSTATASVTIARNGNVISSRIIRSSGNSEIDRSVQMTLDRVRHTVPLPESANESERTVTIKFNAKVKQGLG